MKGGQCEKRNQNRVSISEKQRLKIAEMKYKNHETTARCVLNMRRFGVSIVSFALKLVTVSFQQTLPTVKLRRSLVVTTAVISLVYTKIWYNWR